MFPFPDFFQVAEDLPHFFEDFLHPMAPPFRLRMRRPRERSEPQKVHATWAQAEIFVAYKLSIGYHEDCLENTIQEEVSISRNTGDFDPLFLQYCLRILRTMRNAGRSCDVAETSGCDDVHTGNKYESDDRQANTRKSIDTALGSTYCKDKETVQELENAAKEFHHENHRLHRDPRRYSTSSRSRDQCRGKNKSRPTSATLNGYTGRERSKSIQTGDLVSQDGSTSTTHVGADFSRLRPGSPLHTSNNSFSSFTAGESSSYVPGSNGRQHNTTFRENCGRLLTCKLENRFQELHVLDDYHRVSRGRQGEDIPVVNDQRERRFARYPDNPKLGTGDERLGTSGRLRGVSRDRMEANFSHKECRRSTSTDSASTIMPGNSIRSKGQEKEHRGDRSDFRQDFQSWGYETESESKYRSDYRTRYEARRQSDLFHSRHREASDISSSSTEDWAIRQESRRNGMSILDLRTLLPISALGR
ncbi:hypothetical protein BKA64DRAFT_757565 [Cadophora sp. MPI-SDFR-AT-0126]|nr:hypothetical protein BKA64DRAFT_757565 [Leotiomycetes sp. MPI-SDFR-AT-0126]